MPLGFYALDARIQLARRARQSLDVQYYLIQNDRTGRLLMRNLRDAALRGVRVRLSVTTLRHQTPQLEQPRSICTGGHLIEPYEQNTQQSPADGRSTVLHCSHS
jgi:phosphatidylserine/phosphatidylglycerophosphate/cardiolipin synthase-like enzyme